MAGRGGDSPDPLSFPPGKKLDMKLAMVISGNRIVWTCTRVASYPTRGLRRRSDRAERSSGVWLGRGTKIVVTVLKRKAVYGANTSGYREAQATLRGAKKPRSKWRKRSGIMDLNAGAGQALVVTSSR